MHSSQQLTCIRRESRHLQSFTLRSKANNPTATDHHAVRAKEAKERQRTGSPTLIHLLSRKENPDLASEFEE